MNKDRDKLRAFRLVTSNAIERTDLYVVLAHTYAEAEDIYWNELNGSYPIFSIHEIENTVKVGYRK